MGYRNKTWTADFVLKEIVAWHRNHKPLYSNYLRNHYQELLAAGIRYFGSWAKAVEAAGLDYEDVRRYRSWNKEQIIKTIQKLEQEGADLSFRAMMLSKYAPMVYAAIRENHFGSWRQALEAAGLPASEIYRYRSWTDEQILEEIRRLKKEGFDLSSKKMDEAANPLIATARRRFGNWGAAVERAGLNYEAIRQRRRWTREQIAEEIQRLHKEGADLRSGEIRKTHPSLFAAACKDRFYGGWKHALEAALGAQTAFAS
jgi:biotin operon repressor